MRKKIVAANWKMNMTQGEATAFVSTFLLEIGESKDVEIVIVPPFTAIAAVNGALEQAQDIKVGAQNMHWERSGAFTGEISPAMLRDLIRNNANGKDAESLLTEFESLGTPWEPPARFALKPDAVVANVSY